MVNITAIVKQAAAFVRTNGLVSGPTARIAILHGYEAPDTRSSAVIKIMDV